MILVQDCSHCQHRMQAKRRVRRKDSHGAWFWAVEPFWGCKLTNEPHDVGDCCSEFDNRYSDGAESEKVHEWIAMVNTMKEKIVKATS